MPKNIVFNGPDNAANVDGVSFPKGVPTPVSDKALIERLSGDSRFTVQPGEGDSDAQGRTHTQPAGTQRQPNDARPLPQANPPGKPTNPNRAEEPRR